MDSNEKLALYAKNLTDLHAKMTESDKRLRQNLREARSRFNTNRISNGTKKNTGGDKRRRKRAD